MNKIMKYFKLTFNKVNVVRGSRIPTALRHSCRSLLDFARAARRLPAER